MKYARLMRYSAILASGAMLLQTGGCLGFNTAVQVIQTVLLGVTAAGGIAIIQNI